MYQFCKMVKQDDDWYETDSGEVQSIDDMKTFLQLTYRIPITSWAEHKGGYESPYYDYYDNQNGYYYMIEPCEE